MGGKLLVLCAEGNCSLEVPDVYLYTEIICMNACKSACTLLFAGKPVKYKDTSYNISLSDIIQFTTGMPVTPPIGFIPQPSISFTSESQYPLANTCGNMLKLPMKHKTLEEFGYHMCYGITNCAGFGKP